MDDLVPDVVELLEAVEDVVSILDEVIVEILFLHIVVGLGEGAEKFGRKPLILGFESILLHLFKAAFSLVVLFLKTFVIALHFHLGPERLLEAVEFDDICNFDIAGGEVEHVVERDVVGIHEGAVGQYLVV